MKHLRTLIALINVTLEFFLFTPWMLYCKHLTKVRGEENLKKRDRLAPKFIQYMSKRILWWGGHEVTVIGAENIPDETCVLIGNHQSYFDILSILSTCDVKKMYAYMAKKGIGKVPFLKTWMETIDCVFLDTTSTRGSMEAIREATELIKEGRSIHIFPEGTRSKGNFMREFSPGAIMIATRNKVPVVPFLINGTYKMFEENGNRMVPTKVTITYYPAIETAGMERAEINALTGRIHDFLQEELRKQNGGLDEPPEVKEIEG